MYKLFDSKVAEIASCVHRYVLPFIQLENEWFVYRYVHQLRRRKRRKKKCFDIATLNRSHDGNSIICIALCQKTDRFFTECENMDGKLICLLAFTHTHGVYLQNFWVKSVPFTGESFGSDWVLCCFFSTLCYYLFKSIE